MKKALSYKEFEVFLVRFGSNLQVWPESHRQAALDLVAQNESARRLWRDAQALAALFNTAPPEASVTHIDIDRLAAHLTATIPPNQPLFSRLYYQFYPRFRSFFGLNWQNLKPSLAVGLVAASLLFLVWGGLVPNGQDNVSPFDLAMSDILLGAEWDDAANDGFALLGEASDEAGVVALISLE